jgi:hypothetical protein
VDASVSVDGEAVLQFQELFPLVNVCLKQSHLCYSINNCDVVQYFLEGQLNRLFGLLLVDGKSKKATLNTIFLKIRLGFKVLLGIFSFGLGRAHFIIS